MFTSKRLENALTELEQQAKSEAEEFFHPPVKADKLKVIKKEVDGAFAFITIESPKGIKVTLRYAWRTKQLLGTV